MLTDTVNGDVGGSVQARIVCRLAVVEASRYVGRIIGSFAFSLSEHTHTPLTISASTSMEGRCMCTGDRNGRTRYYGKLYINDPIRQTRPSGFVCFLFFFLFFSFLFFQQQTCRHKTENKQNKELSLMTETKT
jgi:hypothetical protein